MPRKRFKTEEIIQKIRDVEFLFSQGWSVVDACCLIGVTISETEIAHDSMSTPVAAVAARTSQPTHVSSLDVRVTKSTLSTVRSPMPSTALIGSFRFLSNGSLHGHTGFLRHTPPSKFGSIRSAQMSRRLSGVDGSLALLPLATDSRDDRQLGHTSNPLPLLVRRRSMRERRTAARPGTKKTGVTLRPAKESVPPIQDPVPISRRVQSSAHHRFSPSHRAAHSLVPQSFAVIRH